MSFDALAPWYRTLESIAFGNVLQRCRVACLAEIASPRRALIVGEGNGRFLCELLRRYPAVEVDCIDASEQMLQLARKRVCEELGVSAENVRWLRDDITTLNLPERHYDLLVTHFVLDCFAEETLAIVVGKLARAATPEATWLLADFCVPVGSIARFHALAVLSMMYRFFRFTTGIDANRLIDPGPHLQAEGLTLTRQHLFRNGMLKSEIWRGTSFRGSR